MMFLFGMTTASEILESWCSSTIQKSLLLSVSEQIVFLFPKRLADQTKQCCECFLMRFDFFVLGSASFLSSLDLLPHREIPQRRVSQILFIMHESTWQKYSALLHQPMSRLMLLLARVTFFSGSHLMYYDAHPPTSRPGYPCRISNWFMNEYVGDRER